jgi:GGDEF domain-containing protein
MSPAPRPLRVVAISQDKSLLHEISGVLDAVGYDVQTASDLAPEALWRRYSSADFLIIDSRGIEEPTAETLFLDSDNPIYRIFLYDPAKPIDFAAWYGVGIHDALHTPLSRGELLARLRTGARYLEFERRLQHTSMRSAVAGTYSRRGFLRKLAKLTESATHDSSQHAVLATSIDWYHGITRKCGKSAARSVVNAVARAIHRAAGEGAISAYLGEGRFATLLFGQSPATAKSVAESLAKDFGSRESLLDANPRPTLTSAVVPWSAGNKAESFLGQVLETLRLAETSGGDCVVTHGEFSTEFSAWQDEMSTGNPFSNVVAQDIMEPFPALIEHGAEQGELAAALERSGIAVRPHVDREGRIIGIVNETATDSRAGQSANSASDVLAKPETIAHNASFPEIYEAFSSRGCSTLVVTTDNHPLGYLTCDGFLSMIDPITTETFAHTDKSADELTYLAVPSALRTAEA